MADTPSIQLDEVALHSMQELLGEQFNDTLLFCYEEFTRLQQEFDNTLQHDLQAAIRHVHSLKSNAAQFGATSLAQLASEIEQGLINNNLGDINTYQQALAAQTSQSIAKLKVWNAAQ